MMYHPIFHLIPPLVITLTFGLLARKLAQDKGRNVTLWTILGFLPIVNLLVGWYFVGASNLRMERKLDALLQAQGKDPNSIQ